MTRRAPPLLPPDSGLGWTPYGWLVYLGTFFVAPVMVTRAGEAEWWLWPLTIAATLLFLVSYFVGYWVRGRKLVAVSVVQTALGIAFAPINPGSCVFFVYGASSIATLDRSRDAVRGLILVVALGAGTALVTDAPLFFILVAVAISLLVGGVNLHFSQQSRAHNKLRLAHAEIEQLAAIAERERIARDLHDVLGHTLSLIVLKAELAVKLSPIDPERAAREMHDVETVARQTLHDVRLAIRGYRTTLPEEIDRSRSMLKAARIDGTFDIGAPDLPQPVEETLALVLREAVTNVVRHSEASRCAIRLASHERSVTLEVHDDGRGMAASPGLGLRGMRERVEFMGGTVSFDGEQGTRVVVRVPAEPARAVHDAAGAGPDASTHAPVHADEEARAPRPTHPETSRS
jgi:two-component system sensor histidine kinase DesK